MNKYVGSRYLTATHIIVYLMSRLPFDLVIFIGRGAIKNIDFAYSNFPGPTKNLKFGYSEVKNLYLVPA
jgi:hypothetical protein